MTHPREDLNYFEFGSLRYPGYLHGYYHWIDSTPRTGCGVMIGSNENTNPQGFFGLWREDIYPPITSAVHGSYKVPCSLF